MLTSGRERPWDFQVKGKRVVLHPIAAHVVNDAEGLVAAGCAGLGLVQVPGFVTEDAVKAGQLEEVLKSYRPPPMPISIVFATRRHMPQRLRAFIDACCQ